MKKTAIRLLPLVLALLLLFAGCAPKEAAPDTGETCTLVIDCLIPYEAGHQIAKDCSDKGYIVEEVKR